MYLCNSCIEGCVFQSETDEMKISPDRECITGVYFDLVSRKGKELITSDLYMRAFASKTIENHLIDSPFPYSVPFLVSLSKICVARSIFQFFPSYKKFYFPKTFSQAKDNWHSHCVSRSFMIRTHLRFLLQMEKCWRALSEILMIFIPL